MSKETSSKSLFKSCEGYGSYDFTVLNYFGCEARGLSEVEADYAIKKLSQSSEIMGMRDQKRFRDLVLAVARMLEK